MNDHDYHRLLTSLDTAVEILDRNRSPDATIVAAFDALKQARAKLMRAMTGGRSIAHGEREPVGA